MQAKTVTQQQLDDLVRYCREEVGTRYKHQGRLSHVALDCGGLIFVASQKAGLPVVDYSCYTRRPDVDTMVKYILESGFQFVTDTSMKQGDLLQMNYGGQPQHVALVGFIEEGKQTRIIHADASARKVVEVGLTDDLARLVAYKFRFEVEP